MLAIGHDRLVSIDAETTGNRTPTPDFIAKQPKGWRPPGVIIEIGCVEILRDGNGWRKGATWHSYVQPDAPIRPDSMAVHGIKPATLRAAPRFVQIAETLRAFLGDAPLVAHAFRNEKSFLDYEFARAKLAQFGDDVFPVERFICTQEVFARLYPGAPKNLDTVCDRLWLDRSDRFDKHGALLDADLTADAFAELYRQDLEGVPTEGARVAAYG